MYKIHSIFESVQGEGYWAGTWMTFVRFAGCNLNCVWCDTQHEKVNIEVNSASKLVERIKAFKNLRVCFTGGEPMLQFDDGIPKFINTFNSDMMIPNLIHLETNGTLKVSRIWIDWLTVSPKENWIQKKGDELKVIWHGQTQEELKHYLDSEFTYYYLQPEENYFWGVAEILLGQHADPNFEKRRDALLRILKEEPRWKLSLQLQKLLGVR